MFILYFRSIYSSPFNNVTKKYLAAEAMKVTVQAHFAHSTSPGLVGPVFDHEFLRRRYGHNLPRARKEHGRPDLAQRLQSVSRTRHGVAHYDATLVAEIEEAIPEFASLDMASTRQFPMIPPGIFHDVKERLPLVTNMTADNDVHGSLECEYFLPHHGGSEDSSDGDRPATYELNDVNISAGACAPNLKSHDGIRDPGTGEEVAQDVVDREGMSYKEAAAMESADKEAAEVRQNVAAPG